MARILKAQISLLLSALTCAAASARDLDKIYEKSIFKLGDQQITAYLADTEEKREAGLMYVEKLKENEGMLFVFEEERPLAFWMKNTLIPLSIGFLNKSGALVDVQEMEVPKSMLTKRPPSYPSKSPAKLALEMQKSWFKDHKVKEPQALCREKETPSKLTNTSVPPCR